MDIRQQADRALHPVRRALDRYGGAGSLLLGLARLGYAARGVVYIGLGVIALLAAIDLTPRAKGARGVLETWASWPLGLVLITGVGCGLVGFSVWRLVQAAFDADRQGASAKGLAVRIGQAISGVVYGGLAFSAFELLDAFEDIGEADEQDETHRTASAILEAPHGDTLLIAAGLVVLAFGVGNVVQGMAQDFGKRLACDEALCRRLTPLARVGYAARGVATLPTGAFLVLAGLKARAGDARSWGQALQTLELQPFGSWVLGAVAAGLIAFGLFGFVEARYRRIRPPEVLVS